MQRYVDRYLAFLMDLNGCITEVRTDGHVAFKIDDDLLLHSRALKEDRGSSPRFHQPRDTAPHTDFLHRILARLNHPVAVS